MKTDRSVITNNNQEFGQLADPNKLEAQIVHAYDVVDANDTEFQSHKKAVDPLSTDTVRDKHVSNKDIKDLVEGKTNLTGNHQGTWQNFSPSDFDGGQQAIQLQEHIDGSDPTLKHTASVINVEDVAGNFTANEVEGVLAELFTFADDGKTDIATVVGSPATVDDTFSQLQTHIQNSKNTLATNLTDKGQTSVGTETLQALVDKVANVSTGKKWASGNYTASVTGTFEVRGLDFTPSLVIIKKDPTDVNNFTLMDNSGQIVSVTHFLRTTNASSTLEYFNRGTNWTIYSDGFQSYAFETGIHDWIAFE